MELLKKIGIVTFLLLFTQLNYSKAQNTSDISFTAYADAREVVQSSYFELTFTLRNAQGGNFQPPNLNDFNVLAGPNQGFSTSIVNGNVSQESTITYRLQPKRTGTLTIGPARIQAKGNNYRSQPLTIKVSKGQASKGDGSEQVFIKARLRPNATSLENDTGEQLTTVYLGQQVVLDYVLYSQVDVEGLTASTESEYNGFFMREIHQYDSRVMRVIVNGQQYASRILKRVVLYPQQTGTLTIDPLSMVAGVPVPGSSRPRNFFSRRQLRRVPIGTRAIEIEVRSLPQPTPPNFQGLTGSYEIKSGVNSSQITTDDAVSYRLSFEGQGDLKRITAPKLQFPAAFELYDPKELVEEYIDLSSNIKGRKVFEYVLVPKQAGQFTISPSLVVFNPDSAAYQTIQLTPQRVTVKQGSGEKQSGLVAEADNNQGLYPARARPAAHKWSPSFAGTPVFWGLFSLPLVLLGGLFVVLRREDAKPAVDPVLLAQQRARAQALERLQTAQTHREKGEARAFYGEVEGALLGYVSDKLQIPRAELTKANVQSRLQEMGATSIHTEQFLELMKTCEMALYAGMDNAAGMEKTYNQAVDLLTGMLT